MLNLNDWGVPFTEEENALTTAKAAVVRVCSRIEPHMCDYIGDPLSEIGGAVDSWSEGEGEEKAIYARAEIRDSVAAQKIEDGVWKTNWSVFLNYQSIDAGGWVHGVNIESITLVDEPAWPSATWKVVSASNGTKKMLRFTTPYKVVSASGGNNNKKKEGGIIPKTAEELEAENAELKKKIAEYENKAPTGGEGPGAGEVGEGGGGEVDEGGAGGEGPGAGEVSEEGTGGEGEGQEAAALREENKKLKKQMATMLTKDEAKALVAEAINNDHKAQAAKTERDNAYNEFAALRESLGMKTDPAEFKSFGASELKKFTEDLAELKKVAASKGSGFSFNASSGAKGGSTVGRWDSTKKEYVN
jgi:hypothetical protein